MKVAETLAFEKEAEGGKCCKSYGTVAQGGARPKMM
jgi:hypothetical protein